MHHTDDLERSWDHLAKLVADLAPAALAAPTPCPDWDVRSLLNHVLGAARMFTLVNAGHAAGPDAGDLVRDDPAGALTVAAHDNVASWRAPDALDGERCYPFGTFPAPAALLVNLTEVVVHAWDLARAVGAPATIDPVVAATLYDFWSRVPLDDARAHGAFAPAVPLADTAPVAERLLGHLGRIPC